MRVGVYRELAVPIPFFWLRQRPSSTVVGQEHLRCANSFFGHEAHVDYETGNIKLSLRQK